MKSTNEYSSTRRMVVKAGLIGAACAGVWFAGLAAAAADTLADVKQRGELVIATENGSAAVSPVAVALAGGDAHVRDLTLRTPTLDDVFLELTGTHIEREEAEEVAS